MNCRRASHLISPLIDGELCGTEALRVREHLDQCEACRAEYQSMLDIKRQLSGLQVVEPRPGFEQDLLEYLWSAPYEPEWKRRIMGWWHTTDHGNRVRVAAAFAALSLLVLAASVRVTMANSGARPSAAQLAIADPGLSTLPGNDIGFAHETFARPQPANYRPRIEERAAVLDPGVQPIPSWNSYVPVSSAP